MKDSMFFVVLKMSCSISRQNHLLEVNNTDKDKKQNVCYLETPFCFVKHSSYFGDFLACASLAVTDFLCWERKIILNLKTFVVYHEVSIC